MRLRRRKQKARKGDPLVVQSAELLGWALGGLEREIAQTRARLEALIEQAKRLRRRLTPAARRRFSLPGRRRTMSAEARRRISEMMKKRWAQRKRRA